MKFSGVSMRLSEAKWRKATDVNREYALFELVIEGKIILDAGFSDTGVFELSFHDGILDKPIVAWEEFEQVIMRGKQLAETDK